MPLDIICNLNQCKTDLSGEKKKIKENNNDQINNKHTAVINIVGKQNVTFNLTFPSTYNFRRNFFGCNFCISVRMFSFRISCHSNPNRLFDVIISDANNHHFNVMVYPFSADDLNQHLRRNIKKTMANECKEGLVY